MHTVTVVDTSICTDNLGDEIIMDAVNDVVWDLFPTSYVERVPSHEGLSDRTRKAIWNSDICFIGGTNLLSSHLFNQGLWRVRDEDAHYYGATETVCLGTGWNDYMSPPDERSVAFYQRALSNRFNHSARDGYTRQHLSGAGQTALNTSCVTTWKLTPEHCAAIPRTKANAVVFTLSAWRRDEDADRRLISLLRRSYDRLYFFPQMRDDWDYLQTLDADGIEIAGATTEAYTQFLEGEAVDFIGTRLHGGIRALQKKRRALILSIDNRAAEISKDTGLPVVARTETDKIGDWISSDGATDIRLPNETIEAWKAQFAEAVLPRVAKPPVEFKEIDGDAGIGRIRRLSRFTKRSLRSITK